MSSYYEKFIATGEVKCIDEEIPFEIPKGWEWCRLGDICCYLHRGKSPKYGEHKFLPIIAQKCNQWDKIYTDRCLFSSKDYIEKYKEEQYIQKGDIIINSTGGGTVGRTGYIDSYVFANFDRFVVDSHVTLVRPICPIASKYIYYFLISPLIQIGLEDRCSGSTNQIELGTTSIANYIIPMPPINEQHRIIGQINKILPLLERYSANQIAQDKLNSEINVRLKKSILQEAIQGKLVPQVQTEGTAQELLEQIRQEKEQLVKDGKLKKSALTDSVIYKGDDNKYFEKVGKTEQDITDEIPFEIPDDWKWCRIGSVLNIWSARRVHERDWRSSGIPFYRAREIGKMADWGHVDNDLFIEQSLYDEFSKSGVPQIGDLMMTAVGTLGKTYVVETNNPFYYKDGSVLCIGNPFRLNPYYLKLFFESSAFANQYLSESDGTTVATLTMVRLNRYLIPVPPLKEQTRIVEKIKTVTSIMRG